jgi:hypothetical protein
VDADTVWAEDCKELILTPAGETIAFSYHDRYYLQNDPNPYNDSSKDFSSSIRTFSQVGNSYTILELKIPLQTNDFRSDLQVSDPEATIIGLSIDLFNVITVENDTWMGGLYPNYADSSNYGQILFAGPQDRKIPIFEDEIPPTTTTQPPETTQTNDYPGSPRASASSFEAWISLLAIGITVFIVRKRQWRNDS